MESQHGQIDLRSQREEVNPIPMPDLSGVIRSFVELDADVYHQDKQFNGNYLQVERSMIVDGNVTFNGTTFAGKNYIVASGDITFNVSTLESLHDEPLILYSENGDITIRSSQDKFRGIIYAPNGTVQIHTSNFELVGRIIADHITLNGSNFEILEQYDDLSLLNGFSQVMACHDRYYDLMSEVPFNDYNTPSNNATMYEIRELQFQVSRAMETDMVQALLLCHAVLEKVNELKEELVQEQLLLEQIAADPLGDYDGDGLLNGFELEMLSNYTNPLLYDTDGDGIPDGEEDPDQDGLSNLMEQELGTDPLSADTDGDGLKDGSEVRLGTDPLSVDTNGNGLIDSEEIYTQTILGPIPDVKLEITAIGDISEAVYIYDATSNIVADHEYSVTDSVYSVSGLYEFRSELPFERARIHLPVDLDKLGDREIEHVKMVYFDEELMTFIPLEKQGVDPATGTVWGETDHFSLYTLFYLPNLGAIWQVPFISGDRESNTEIIFLDVMFVIDSSGSMDWNDPNDYRKTAAKNFVDGLIPGTRVGVATVIARE
ncbi:hypothetical protein PRECH8_21090 [Insulibacter thermoxylanivorax]|uniref:DUF7305 domain-containing protein n=1 Tax=Insulibacter thermoxylanivorax TaxID=2749268 RepID=A0A916VGC4_9BACL|nr:hypothetical protein PRECH8_21090 [Insulibacter thermoxylanivorax]